MNEEKKQLDAKLLEIAEHLPGKWTLNPKYDDSYWMAQLIDGEGHGINAAIVNRNVNRKGRLHISGSWPMDKAGIIYTPYVAHKITVGFNRESAAIAIDIERRFLTDYLEAYAEAAERAGEVDARKSQQEELAKELADIMGEEPYQRNGTFIIQLSGCRNEIEITLNSEVNIALHCEVNIALHYLDAEKAKAILRAIKRILSK